MKNKKKSNRARNDKLILEILNTETNKSAKIHFPIITPNRHKWFNSLNLKPDNYVILNSNFPISDVNRAILNAQSSLQEINYFSLIYFQEMEEDGREIFCDLIRSGYVKVENSRDIIDLLNNLNLYYTEKNVHTPSDVAWFKLCLFQAFSGNGGEIPECSQSTFNCMGKFIIEQEKGMFYKNMYIGLYSQDAPRKWDGIVPDCMRLFDSK